jgi:hypothetical protein
MNNEPVAWLEPEWGQQICPEVGYEITFTSDHPKDLCWIPLYTHPVKELTDEDRVKVIGTLKWAEDLLREAGHDEAVNDVQDCLMILRKAQEK